MTELVPDGLYPATIYNVERKNSNAGSDMLVLTLKITEGEWASHTIPDYYVLTLEQLGKLKGLLLALGWSSELLTGEFAFEPGDLLGKPVVIQVTHRPYEGQERNSIKATYGP